MSVVTLAAAAAPLLESAGHAATPAAPLLPTPIISPDGHFRVHAPAQEIGVAAGLTGQALAERLASLLQPGEGWETPIAIFIYEVADPAEERRGLLHAFVQGSLHLELHLACHQNVPERPFRLGLVQLLLCDLMYPRYGGTVTQTVRAPPAWIAAGVAELVGPGYAGAGLDLAEVSRRLAAGERRELLSATRLLELERIPAAPAEQQVVGAYAGEFIRSLLLLPRGPDRIARCLRLAGAPRGTPAGAFWESFGELWGGQAEALEKWWVLELSSRADTGRAGTLSFAETLRQLDEILLTPAVALPPLRGVPPVPAGKANLSLDELWDWKRHPQFQQLVLAKRYRILSLYTRANRLAAPVLDAYLTALDWLLRGSRARFRAQLERAAAQLAAARRQMDWLGQEVDVADLAGGATAQGERQLGLLLESLGRGDEAAPIPASPAEVRSYVDRFDPPPLP